jgi:hypothetical protein
MPAVISGSDPKRTSDVRPCGRLLGFPSLDCINDVANLPKLFGNASRHYRRNTKRLMDADEIVKHLMQRDRISVVFDLL